MQKELECGGNCPSVESPAGEPEYRHVSPRPQRCRTWPQSCRNTWFRVWDSTKRPLPSGVLQRAISFVKLQPSLMFYGNTWFWDHRRLNLVSIASDMLKIPQRAWQSNLWIRWWDCDSGSSPRYAFDCYQDLDLDPLSKCNRGPMAVIYESWMHKSGKRSSSWRTLSRLRPAGTGYRTFIESGKAASGLIVAARKVIETCITCIYIVWLETGASYSSKCGRFHRGCLRSWPIFFFGNKVTDQICSISRRKKNPTKQCNTLQGPCCI